MTFCEVPHNTGYILNVGDEFEKNLWLDISVDKHTHKDILTENLNKYDGVLISLLKSIKITVIYFRAPQLYNVCV